MTPTTARKSATAALLILAFAMLVSVPPAGTESLTAQGFGAATPGGSGKPVVRVTNLNDSGPGSFREALRGGGHRTIVFDVAGEIRLSTYLYVSGPFVTIDGLSAPSPGITLRDRGLVVRGSRGAHDVIVRGIRVRDASLDGLQVSGGAYNVVIDRVSVHRSGDGNLDITEGAHDVTVSWSIFSSTPKNMLVKYGISRITLHHNLFVDSNSRNPQVRIDELGTVAKDTTVDMRNNVIAGWGLYGTLIWTGAWANVANNYYAGGRHALDVEAARAYVGGNVSGDGARLDHVGTEARPFPAPFVETQDACTAAAHVLEGAGVHPRDAIDGAHVTGLSLAGCAAVVPASLVAIPGTLAFSGVAGATIPIRQTINVAATPATPLQWTATATTTGGHPWVVLSPAVGTVPGTIQVSVDSLGMPAGTYEAAVTLQRADDPTRRVTVPVSLALTPPLPSGSSGEARVRVQGVSDDAHEFVVQGTTRVGSTRVSIGRGVIAGFRFDGVAIPARAVIRSAVLHLYVEKRGARPVAVRYFGEAAADTLPFTNAPFNLSSRRRTVNFVDSSPDAWSQDTFAASPDLRAVVQEIVASPGWSAGNAMTLFVDDAGSPDTRFVVGFEPDTQSQAAVLVISYDR